MIGEMSLPAWLLIGMGAVGGAGLTLMAVGSRLVVRRRTRADHAADGAATSIRTHATRVAPGPDPIMAALGLDDASQPSTTRQGHRRRP